MSNTINARYSAITTTGSSIEARTDGMPMDVHKMIVLAMTKPDDVLAILTQRDELLEVLRAIINDGMHCDVVPHLQTRARAAIAKAESGSA